MREGGGTAGVALRVHPYAGHFESIRGPRETRRKTPENHAEGTAPRATDEGRAVVLLPVDVGQRTTMPAWLSAENEKMTRMPGGLQPQG